jgi:succinyl-diaminopimelate desuccinylase
VYAHMDVVPVDDAWTQDPFGGEVVDGKLYGRGTVDNKGPIACVLGAMKVLHDMGVEPCYAIDCLLCTDEEVGFYPGSRYLAEEGYFSNHILWLDLGAIEPIFVIGAAGSVAIDIVATGKSCHSGMNYLGVNAVEESLPIMQELMTLKRAVQSRQSSVPALPIPGNPSTKMQPMFNLNIIRGGTKDNIVPGECRLTINRRYIMEERYEDVVAEIRQAVDTGRANSKLLGLKIESKHAYPPMVVDAHTPATSRMKAAMKAVLGYENLIYGGLSGSTDLGFVIEALKPDKAQVAGFGVSRAADMRAHAADEFVHVKDLITVTKELAYYFAA